MRVGLTTFIVTLVALPALAGTPVEQSVTCPVGGETFTITGTASCSVIGRTMSFRPITSCDFVTRLPVCPGNGLPLFDEFTDAELTILRDLIGTPKYANLQESPPWVRAYFLALRIGRQDTASSFRLILNALWYEPDAFRNDDALTDAFLREVGLEKARVGEANHPFLEAISIYAMILSGRTDKAAASLETLRASGTVPNGLVPYLFRLSNCIEDPTAADCAPDVPINN